MGGRLTLCASNWKSCEQLTHLLWNSRNLIWFQNVIALSYVIGMSLIILMIVASSQFIENIVSTRVTNSFSAHEKNCIVTREINTKITLEWAQKQFIARVHTLFYFFHDKMDPLNDDKNNDLYTTSPCLTRLVFVLLTSQSIADGITMIRQLWHNHMNDDI